jgi:voltage-gated potassium channel
MLRLTWDGLLNQLADLDAARREILLASLLILVLIVTGTAGYATLEGWYWHEGLYMTFITLTTIGFAEVRPLSPIGRLFTVFIGIIGIGLVTFVAARAAQLLVASDRLEERRIMKAIDDLRQHYIICGYGRVGQRLVEDLERAGRDFVVIDRSDDEIERLREAGHLHVQGEAADEETLTRAGLARAHGLILSLPNDTDNVFVALTAREMNPGVYILARTMDHRNRSKLLSAGADKVIAPSEVGADRMAQVILRPHVDDFLARVLQTDALSLHEVEVRPGAPLAGQTLAESNFRQQFEAIVIGMVNKGQNRITFNPDPSDRIHEGDVLIVVGRPEMVEALRNQGCREC